MSLDLYEIDDGTTTPDDPGLLRHLGSVTMQEHRSLEPVWELLDPELRLAYFEDNRLDAERVVRLHDRLHSKGDEWPGQNVTVNRIVAMLDAAIQQHAGIVAFCD